MPRKKLRFMIHWLDHENTVFASEETKQLDLTDAVRFAGKRIVAGKEPHAADAHGYYVQVIPGQEK